MAPLLELPGPDGSLRASSLLLIERMITSLSARSDLHQTLGICGLVRELALHSPILQANESGGR